ENDFLKYGKSKENRPNPIVQYGLFMDANGLPIADMTFEGNKNEQFSLRELEKQIEKDFQFSRFIVCADAGLNGWENKVYNDKKA
ncbi:transposase, partial [Clostridium sp. DFI.1.208]|nr:transposase [Clostridium sp. DFI.1.208]